MNVVVTWMDRTNEVYACAHTRVTPERVLILEPGVGDAVRYIPLDNVKIWVEE